MTWGRNDGPSLAPHTRRRHDGRMTTTIPHWIDGRAHPGSGARAGDVTNPPPGQVTGRAAFAGPEEIEAGVASAKGASAGWAATWVSARPQVVFRSRELLNERREELARIITAE